MEKYFGKSVMDGIAIGKMYCYKKRNYKVEKKKIKDVAGESKRLDKALQKAKEQLVTLYEETLRRAGEKQAMIFDMHRMMLDDEDYLEAIKGEIKCGVNAEYAVKTAKIKFCEMFADMDDEYMKARALDITDISDRVIDILSDAVEDTIQLQEPVIVVAEDLTPSETIRMNKDKILAFVTAKGSANSHTAILARSINLPALVNTHIDIDMNWNGKMAIVDGFNGEFIVEPEEHLLNEKIKRKNRWITDREELQKLKGKENITGDGRKINIYANIGDVNDVDRALDEDAGGIGLFRSEFLYLGRSDFPTEEEQFECYKTVLEKMKGKKVIIRTMDIGADKKVDYFNLDPEENPALGYRAIRICLDRPEIFITQLRAIYRASVYGTAAIMFPMITSLEEIRKIKEIVDRVKRELTAEGCRIRKVELGIMVETPAAAIMADEFAKEVDFFSIGTNDLTQYTLAADRQNQKTESYCDSHNPAVLRLIEQTIESGHKAGIWVGICGELAGDTRLTGKFMEMGVDELSVSPASVLRVRKAVREL